MRWRARRRRNCESLSDRCNHASGATDRGARRPRRGYRALFCLPTTVASVLLLIRSETVRLHYRHRVARASRWTSNRHQSSVHGRVRPSLMGGGRGGDRIQARGRRRSQDGRARRSPAPSVAPTRRNVSGSTARSMTSIGMGSRTRRRVPQLQPGRFERFDLAGSRLDENGYSGNELYVECKQYSSADRQEKLYDEYLASVLLRVRSAGSRDLGAAEHRVHVANETTHNRSR